MLLCDSLCKHFFLYIFVLCVWFFFICSFDYVRSNSLCLVSSTSVWKRYESNNRWIELLLPVLSLKWCRAYQLHELIGHVVEIVYFVFFLCHEKWIYMAIDWFTMKNIFIWQLNDLPWKTHLNSKSFIRHINLFFLAIRSITIKIHFHASVVFSEYMQTPSKACVALTDVGESMLYILTHWFSFISSLLHS